MIGLLEYHDRWLVVGSQRRRREGLLANLLTRLLFNVILCCFIYHRLMKGLDHKTCAIRGEPVYYPGSANDLSKGRIVDNRVVDGVNTMMGVVCRDCMPVLAMADRMTLTAFDSHDKRKEMHRLISDPAFVSAAIQEGARNRIESILGDFSDEESWKGAVRELKIFLTQRLNINSFAGDDSGLPSERALGCMLEERRTMKFAQGLYGALAALDVRRDEIEMVDAGTGPIPIFGILAALKSPKVKVTCLEINQGSAKMAAKIIERLCLQDRVKILCTDATQYQHDKTIDLLISETMHVGLTEEPQAQIFGNLAPQVAVDGVVVPEKVIIKAGLARDSQIHPSIIRQMLTPENQTYFMQYTLDPREVAALSRDNLLKVVDFDLPVDSLSSGRYRVILSSNVEVFGGVRMVEEDSVITAPSLHGTVLDINDQVNGVSVSYAPGTRMEEVSVALKK